MLRTFISACAAMLLALPAQSATVNFDFSFNNALYGGGLVYGRILGLTDNATTSAASVRILSHSGLIDDARGEYVGSPVRNSFTVVDGRLTAYDFFSLGERNASPAATQSSLYLNSAFFAPSSVDVPTQVRFRASLSPDPDSARVYSAAVSRFDINFQAERILDDPNDVEISPVPLPASSLLLLSGLLGLTVMRRKVAAT